jgi:hypothetical protein
VLDERESSPRLLIHEWQTHTCSNALLQCKVFKSMASLLEINDECSELVEELALQRFGKKVVNHFFRGTAFDRKFIHVDAVGDEIESAIEMLGSLAA